jgi:hypothetical protein
MIYEDLLDHDLSSSLCYVQLWNPLKIHQLEVVPYFKMITAKLELFHEDLGWIPQQVRVEPVYSASADIQQSMAKLVELVPSYTEEYTEEEATIVI